MSILIKGMGMPQSCPCEIIGVGYDLYCSFAYGIPARVKEYDECCTNGTRPSWCPLVEIPPHGRLIDADALEEYCKRQVRDEWNQKAGTSWSYAFAEFENIVDDCDTIIEAEGVKE